MVPAFHGTCPRRRAMSGRAGGLSRGRVIRTLSGLISLPTGRRPIKPAWTGEGNSRTNRPCAMVTGRGRSENRCPPPLLLLRAQFPDRPYFNASLARRRNLRGHLDRVVQVSRLDQVKARQLLLRLDEGTVGDRQLAIPDAHGRRCFDGLECLRGDQEPALPEPRTAGNT